VAEPVSAQRSAPGSTAAGAPVAAATSTASPRLLPGTRRDVFTTINGNALSANNARIAGAVVRLRNARVGGISGRTVTDRSGLFTFQGIEPGTYIVELLDAQETVVAASQLLDVGAGEVATTVVKLPFGPAPLGGLLGHTVSSAAAIASAAAASGVLAAAVTGQPSSLEEPSQ
jgi:hypothetical protein